MQQRKLENQNNNQLSSTDLLPLLQLAYLDPEGKLHIPINLNFNLPLVFQQITAKLRYRVSCENSTPIHAMAMNVMQHEIVMAFSNNNPGRMELFNALQDFILDHDQIMDVETLKAIVTIENMIYESKPTIIQTHASQTVQPHAQRVPTLDLKTIFHPSNTLNKGYITIPNNAPLLSTDTIGLILKLAINGGNLSNLVSVLIEGNLLHLEFNNLSEMDSQFIIIQNKIMKQFEGLLQQKEIIIKRALSITLDRLNNYTTTQIAQEIQDQLSSSFLKNVIDIKIDTNQNRLTLLFNSETGTLDLQRFLALIFKQPNLFDAMQDAGDALFIVDEDEVIESGDITHANERVEPSLSLGSSNWMQLFSPPVLTETDLQRIHYQDIKTDTSRPFNIFE